MNELPNNNAHLLRDLVKEKPAQYLKEQSDKDFDKKLKKK